MSAALVARGVTDVAIEVDSQAIIARDNDIAWARLTTDVSTPDQLTDAVEALRGLKALEKSVEATRGAVKAPVLELSRKIDNTAKEFLAPVLVESRRLDSLITGYHREQERLRREAEEKRKSELSRLAEEERQRLAKIEADRREAEMAAQAEAAAAATILDGPADIAATAAPALAQASAVAGQQAAQLQTTMRAERTAVLAATAPALVIAKPEGMSVRKQPMFRVTDPAALSTARPDLVTITPKAREIASAMREAGEWEGEREMCPGLVGWWDGKVVVR